MTFLRTLPLLVVSALCLALAPLPPAEAGLALGNACPSISSAAGPGTPCVFVCGPGDLVRVRVETTANGHNSVAISGSCGGASVRCQGSNVCTEDSAGTASSASLGTCTVEAGNALGWCTAIGPAIVDLPPAANDAIGLALSLGNEGQLIATTTARSVVDVAGTGANAPTSCAAYYLNSCDFPCLPGDTIVIEVRPYRPTPWPIALWGDASCGGVMATCNQVGPCTATSAGTSTSASMGLCRVDMRSVAVCYSRRAQPPQDVVAEAATGAAGLAVGTALWGAGVALGTADSLNDHDRDSHRVPEEATGNSDPLNGGSRPTSDDDGDGVQNKDERSRAHAATTLVGNARARATSSDRVTFHFGHAGASATVRSPEGNLMTVTYTAASVSSGCPPPVVVSIPDLSPCMAPPAVATFGLAGDFVSARRADQPATSVPASAFAVACTPRASGRCLDGVGMDGTWTFVPATQALALSTAAKVPAGFAAVIGGKTYQDVAPDSGDILGSGSGENNRDPLMPARLWNWHEQAPGATQDACSGGLAASCLTESAHAENALRVRLYL